MLDQESMGSMLLLNNGGGRDHTYTGSRLRQVVPTDGVLHPSDLPLSSHLTTSITSNDL